MKLQSFLIDPFQKKVHPIEIENDITEWYKILQCDHFDHAVLGQYKGLPIDVWVDDEGLLREPNWPHWYWSGYQNELAGYGLINSSNQEGESISSNLDLVYCMMRAHFEPWENRLNPEDYLEQMTKIYAFDYKGSYGIGTTQMHICSICKTPYQGYGNNADPFEGRCCDRCNKEIVIPARMSRGRKENVRFTTNE
jgi:hypothetical protein